ncbi:hypothetical protein ACSFA2_03685 [Variovorax sp. LT2P21]|uniref:hypothetical protein n=1 Tax=Variovorax sp. LT2P21 TaxID=3443731 RepID=UPI003F48D28F
MTIKCTTLGRATAAAAGITISAATNATPIVITLGATSGLKDGDRIAISGITGNTAANGEFTLKMLTATTAQLVGSVGNGAFGGTARVAVICDVTPNMAKHSNALNIAGTLVGTLDIEAYDSYADFAAGTNASGSATAPVVSPAVGTNTAGSGAAPAKTTIVNPDAGMVCEVKLARYMRTVVTAFTSGTVNVEMMG